MLFRDQAFDGVVLLCGKTSAELTSKLQKLLLQYQASVVDLQYSTVVETKTIKHYMLVLYHKNEQRSAYDD